MKVSLFWEDGKGNNEKYSEVETTEYRDGENA